ncbi:Frataxin- mitochondrial [Striga hermonthica]|uniref:ferroxidase n=1 Tax=Striga hermonthica TaxID=68872 RepID=A0A9N7RD93_STRHE|nr:Frataxin- mitochondrial [Striga hermonthica]
MAKSKSDNPKNGSAPDRNPRSPSDRKPHVPQTPKSSSKRAADEGCRRQSLGTGSKRPKIGEMEKGFSGTLSKNSGIRKDPVFVKGESSNKAVKMEPKETSTSAPFPRPNFTCTGVVCRRLSYLSEMESLGPASIDYRSVLQEDEYHRLANSTIHDLLEKLEDYGDTVEIDGFDVDYGNEVLTLKLGSLGTYVINKQTPNRQIWMSSPVSGPSRFDWDQDARSWIYRRTKQDLFKLLENELQKLCGEFISLS